MLLSVRLVRPSALEKLGRSDGSSTPVKPSMGFHRCMRGGKHGEWRELEQNDK